MIFEWLTIELVLSILAIVVSVWSVYQNKKDGFAQLTFERRLEVYSELAGYLQKVTDNHEKAEGLQGKITALITKTAFYASRPINALFQEFLDEKIYDKEVKLVKTQKDSRDKSFNVFDVYVATLIQCMAYEAKHHKNITSKEVEKKLLQQFKRIGIDYMDKQIKDGQQRKTSSQKEIETARGI